MTTIKYTGPADERSVTKSDLTRHGVEDAHAIKFNAKNNFQAEVSEEMAKKLVELDPKAFKEVTSSDESQSSSSSAPKESSGDPTGDEVSSSSDDVDDSNLNA